MPEVVPVPSVMLPLRLDHYTLLQELDGGGMATIYLARRGGPGGFARLVAAKRIRPELARDASLVASFVEEARLSGLLRHPNIVPALDLVEQEGVPCMMLEFVHGRVASVVAQRGAQSGRPLPRALAVGLVTQALAGLAHAHEATDPASGGQPLRLIHRDISPQNLLCGFDGVVRLFDFGIAETSQHPAGTLGVLSGKYAYLSPEQARGQTLDARSDLFAMGTILYELLTQSRLFKRSGQVLTLRAVTEEPIPAPRERTPELPEELERITLRALERDPARRYASAREMADDLTRWLAQCPEPSGPAALADYLDELFGEEAAREREEHSRLLSLPEPEGGAAPVVRSEATAPRARPAGGRLELHGEALSGLGTAPLLVPGGGVAPASGSGLVAAPAPSPPPSTVPWLRSLALGVGLALLIVLAAALVVLLVRGGAGAE